MELSWDDVNLGVYGEVCKLQSLHVDIILLQMPLIFHLVFQIIQGNDSMNRYKLLVPLLLLRY